jgi:hypothetical protein
MEIGSANTNATLQNAQTALQTSPQQQFRQDNAVQQQVEQDIIPQTDPNQRVGTIIDTQA